MENSAHTLLRIDTDNYGHVVSHHETFRAADSARDELARGLPRDAIVDCIWAVVPGTLGEPGKRVRY